MSKICIKSLTLKQLASELQALGEKPYRAKQIFPWLYRRDVASFHEMTDISQTLRETLDKHFSLLRLEVAETLTSEDGTRKLALRTADGHLIESVLIPEPRRLTVCLSTQIGCRFGCRFCRTGTMGLIRSLTTGEIVEQFLAVQRLAGERRISNLVLMGMGEPLDNYENVMGAISIWRDDYGPNLSPRKVTLSTVGIVPQLDRLGKEIEISLAISLHAADDKTRDQLVPINRKYPLKELMDACRRYPLSPRRRITFEYALVRGVNDSEADALKLVDLVKPLRPKINLIACNPFAGSGYEPPDDATVDGFLQILLDHNLTAIVRKPRGRDILAACGQLAVKRD